MLKTGLVLTAGGARGAYQAGVLKRVGELKLSNQGASPFPIVTGASAGAINGAFVAGYATEFAQGTQQLAELWASIHFENVFRTDMGSLGSGAVRWLRDLALGGMMGGGTAQSLLDASPLHEFLARVLPLNRIAQSVQAGALYALAVSATSYYSGKSYTFIQGQTNHPVWTRSRRIAEPVELTVEHICASAAIPIVFQAWPLKTESGTFYFGDGGLRLVAPLSPAIRLGADRLFAIGIRVQKNFEARAHDELFQNPDAEPAKLVMKAPPLAQVIGIALNAIFLDHLDSDLEHLERMNSVMRPIPSFSIFPSQDLSAVAETFSHKMPRLLGYFMEGLGASVAQSADLMSYLLFDPDYTRTLIEIGYHDANERIDEIESFLEASQHESSSH
jgi:NTE family protein